MSILKDLGIEEELLPKREPGSMSGDIFSSSQSALNNVKLEDTYIMPIMVELKDSEAATGTNYGIFFTNSEDQEWAVVAAQEVHTNAGTDAASVTLQIERLQNSEALDSGDEILNTAFDLKGTANIVQHGNFVGKADQIILRSGDRLALKDSGTLTDVKGVQVTVFLKQFVYMPRRGKRVLL